MKFRLLSILMLSAFTVACSDDKNSGPSACPSDLQDRISDTQIICADYDSDPSDNLARDSCYTNIKSLSEDYPSSFQCIDRYGDTIEYRAEVAHDLAAILEARGANRLGYSSNYYSSSDDNDSSYWNND